MSSSSTVDRPFSGRLRSSSRPGSAGQSINAFVCTTPSITYIQHGSNEPNCRTRSPMSHTSSSSVGAHEGGEDVSASTRTAVCRPGVAVRAQPVSATEGAATPGPADKGEASKATDGLKHRNNGNHGVKACSSVTDVGYGLGNATAIPPEDKRAARRRRRAEAAAAAAAAALESERSNETCRLLREAVPHASPIAGADRTQTRRPSTRGHSGVEGKSERHTKEPYADETRSFVSAASSLCSIAREEPARSPEPRNSSLTASTERARCANSLKMKQDGERAHREASAESAVSLGDHMSSQAAEGTDACDRGPEATNPVPVSHVTDARCAVMLPAGPCSDPERPEPADSGGCVSRDSVNVSVMETACQPDLTTSATASAVDASIAIPPAFDSESGYDCDKPHICGTDPVCRSEFPSVNTSFSCATEGAAVRGGARVCPCEAAGGQAEVNKTLRRGYGIVSANASRGAPENGEMSAHSSCADTSTTTTRSPGATQPECSSGSHGADACATRASECSSQAAGDSGRNMPLTHAPEPRRPSQEASYSLREEEIKQPAQEGLPQIVGPEHDDGKGMCMPGRASRTSSEEAHQNTTAVDPLAVAEDTSVRHTAVLGAPEAAACSCTMKGFHLTPVLHGLECLRGELLLSKEEYEAMQILLRPLFYRLVPCASTNECVFGFHEPTGRVHSTRGGIGQLPSVNFSAVRFHKEGRTSSRGLAQELQVLQQAACGFTALPLRGSKRRREPLLKGFQDDEAEAGSATYSSSHSSGGSFCSVGTHRREHDGAGEDSGSRKGYVTLPGQEESRRRQQSRARKLPLRLDDDAEGEEDVTDIFRGRRRTKQVRVSASQDVERASFVNSDDGALLVAGGPPARRSRGSSSNSWSRMHSFDDAFGKPCIVRKQQLVYGDSQTGRANTVREGGGGKGACMEMEVHASTASTRGHGARRSDSRGHRRRHRPEQSNCEGFDRFEHDAYGGNAGETDARPQVNRRIRGARQKRRRGGILALGARSGENRSGTKFRVGSCGSTTAFGSSLSFQVSPTMDWRQSCFQILQHLKRQPAARWFLSPDCDASGNAEPPLQRVYLEDIEQKLTSCMSPHGIREAIAMSIQTVAGAPAVCCAKGYVHPSQWQQEVRQIFFHAFTLHPVYHEVWRDATILAAEFERCCRLVHQVNPYYPLMLKRQRYSSRAFVHGVAGRSAKRACVPGISAASRGAEHHSYPQPPVSCMVYEKSPRATSTRTLESHSSSGGSFLIPGPGVAPYLHQTIPLAHPQQVQFSQPDLSGLCHHLAFRASAAPSAAVAAAGALGEGSAAVAYAPGTPYPRGGGGKQHGDGRSNRAWGEGGVRGKRQQQHQQHQHGLGIPEGRVVSEDADLIRNPDGSLVYAYAGQYGEIGRGIPGDEGGKCSRVVVTATAAGSPRRGCRAGGRGRGNIRGGRGTGVGNDARGSALLSGQHLWTTVASQGSGGVSEHRFIGTIGNLQQQPFTSGGRMLPLGVVPGAPRARDRGMMLMGTAGVPAVTGFAGGQPVHARGGSADLLLLSSSNVLETIQQMDAPADAPVLPPPPIPRIGVNDKPLSNSQRRTLEQNMQRLSPLQRKAALELIQDDLGILAAEYMNVKAFAFDTELLSIEKQKRLFAFVNSMSRANREILLRQHEELVAAAQASAMSAATDGGAGAVLQPSGARRSRRQRRQGSLGGEPAGVQSRSGSSSSSSGSDSDSSSSSLSSSDTSSSSSSSDSEEESEESEGEGQKASASTFDASSSAAQQESVSGVDRGDVSLQSTGDGCGRTGKGTASHNSVSETREEALLPASGTWDQRGGCGEVESEARWAEDMCTTGENGPHCGREVIDGVLFEKKNVDQSSGMLPLQRGAHGVKCTSLTGTARQGAGCLDSETAAEGRMGTPGECAHRGSTQGEDVGAPSGGSSGMLSMPNPQAESPFECSAGATPFPRQRSGCSDAVSTQGPDSSAACSTGGDEGEISGLRESAAANGKPGTESLLEPYGTRVALKATGGGGCSLPQYTPVCEEEPRVEIRAEVMRRHADFLGVLAVREAGASENEVGIMEAVSSRVALSNIEH